MTQNKQADDLKEILDWCSTPDHAHIAVISFQNGIDRDRAEIAEIQARIYRGLESLRAIQHKQYVEGWANAPEAK